MSNYEKIKRYYDLKIYKKKHIEIFYKKGIITQEEYNSIIK